MNEEKSKIRVEPKQKQKTKVWSMKRRGRGNDEIQREQDANRGCRNKSKNADHYNRVFVFDLFSCFFLLKF